MDRVDSAWRAVEAVACPACGVPAGRPCRTRSGRTSYCYHTHRLVLIPKLGNVGQLAVPVDRGPGARWAASTTPPPAVRIGYAYRSRAAEDLSGQQTALTSAGCVRVYVDEVAITVAARPALEEALTMAAQQRRSAQDQQAIIVVHDIAQLARHSRELIQLTAAIYDAGLCLQVLAGTLHGLHDPETDTSGLFSVLTAAIGLDRLYLTEKSKAGARAAPSAGRPRIFDAGMLADARRLRDQGFSVPEIARRLVIPTGDDAGRHPSLATVYRALAQPEPVSPPQMEQEHDHVVDQTISTRAGSSDG
jgi:DNA invertase Pin-like site-specific DNA recombinase